MVAQGDDAGAGQGRHIDNLPRVEALGVGQGVGQNQPAFGVGVEHFDGATGQGGQNVSGSKGAAGG